MYYYPYGEIHTNNGTGVARYKFTGQEYDAETGLYYYGARYYDPKLARFITADTIVQDFTDPQTLNRYSYCTNNPINLIDPTGHFSFGKFLKSVISGIAGGAAFVLSGGNPIVAGIVAGVVSGVMTGKIENVVIGAAIGGVLGGVGGAVYSAFGNTGVYAMLGAGAAYSVTTEGLDGLAYFAGGIAGGIGGAVIASNLISPVMTSGQPIDDDPLLYDGKKLIATDANGNQIGSWDATSGRPGMTPADQYKISGPIPEGRYSVNSNAIQKWSDLPLYKQIAAYNPFWKTTSWPGGTVAWGHYRVPIEISPGTYIGQRTGSFFIHGGLLPGSSGCIDLGANEASFFGYLSGQNNVVPLTVQY